MFTSRNLEWEWCGETYTAKRRPISECLRSLSLKIEKQAYVCAKTRLMLILSVAFVRRKDEYKGLNKVWKGKSSEEKASGNPIKIQEAQDIVVLYGSLQLTPKCILNSFYINIWCSKWWYITICHAQRCKMVFNGNGRSC
ncbi:putative DNA-directed DNA polymerase [Helianthus debilis subsp. tardiflorus]